MKATESAAKDNAASRWLSFWPEIKVVDCTIRDGGRGLHGAWLQGLAQGMRLTALGVSF